MKKLLGYLPSNNTETAPVYETDDDPNRLIPELNSLIPESPNKPYDIHDLITLLVDNGDFLEYQPYYAANMVTCFARMNGRSIGIIANQPKMLAGCLDINASDKAARFVRTLRRFQRTPPHPGRRARIFAGDRPGMRRTSSGTGPSCSTPTVKRRCRP